MIDGYEHKATIEIIENGFLVTYKDAAYRHIQKAFGNIEDAIACVREQVFPEHVADRHPSLAGKE